MLYAQFPFWARTLLNSYPAMSRPTKRSRIVTDDTIPSSSHSSEPLAPQTTTTCTNNNARRLAHAVTLRLSQQRDRRRQTQQSAHTTLQQRDVEMTEDGDVDMLFNEWTDGVPETTESANAEKGKRTDVPKERAVVRAVSK